MPNIPAPCTNCLRFHYGVCWERPKQCFQCGGFNHIERYCPYQRRVQVNSGGPLPGTREWCDRHGLDSYPELKRRILNAIKTSPGCAIWLDGVCIYGGNQRHFSRDDMPGRHSFNNRSDTRRRSRSPLGDRFRGRSPSPRRRTRSMQKDPFGYDITPPRGRSTSSNQFRRFRSRSPLRPENSSPNKHSDPKQQHPSYSLGVHAIVHRAKDNSQGRSTQITNVQGKLPLFSFEPHLPIPVSNVIHSHDLARNADADRARGSSKPVTMTGNELQQLGLPNIDKLVVEDFHVEDPYFILGVIEGAGEQE